MSDNAPWMNRIASPSKKDLYFRLVELEQRVRDLENRQTITIPTPRLPIYGPIGSPNRTQC